jgi:hypothetical protein
MIEAKGVTDVAVIGVIALIPSACGAGSDYCSELPANVMRIANRQTAAWLR